MKVAENTEIKIGNIVFTVVAEVSGKATESVEQKVKRLILGSACDKNMFSESYQKSSKTGLAISKTLR